MVQGFIHISWKKIENQVRDCRIWLSMIIHMDMCCKSCEFWLPLEEAVFCFWACLPRPYLSFLYSVVFSNSLEPKDKKKDRNGNELLKQKRACFLWYQTCNPIKQLLCPGVFSGNIKIRVIMHKF